MVPNLQKFRLWFLVGIGIFYTWILWCFNGTGDDGDSIFHFLYAKYSFKHPELFLHHWAKPVFVLLASPFAQFGFFGLKVFNVLLSLGSVWMVEYVARKLGYSFSILGSFFQAMAPLALVLAFSGLTEPLFAFLCMSGLLSYLLERKILALVLLSFLPFVRTEGFLFLGLIALVVFWEREWKVLPFLFFGFLFYAILGGIVSNDFLWFFHQMPYNSGSSHYGHGHIFHFLDQLFYVVGLPFYSFLIMGLFAGLVQIFQGRLRVIEVCFIYGGFVGYVMAHSLCWYFGIFDSMGLKRVLVGVLPLASLIALNGLNWFVSLCNGKKQKVQFVFSIGFVVLIFPFLGTPSSIHWQELRLNAKQEQVLKMKLELKPWMKEGKRVSAAYPFIYYELDVDCFDSDLAYPLSSNPENWESGDLLIWDSDFASIENGVSKENLLANPKLEIVYERSESLGGRLVEIVVFHCK